MSVITVYTVSSCSCTNDPRINSLLVGLKSRQVFITVYIVSTSFCTYDLDQTVPLWAERADECLLLCTLFLVVLVTVLIALNREMRYL